LFNSFFASFIYCLNYDIVTYWKLSPTVRKILYIFCKFTYTKRHSYLTFMKFSDKHETKCVLLLLIVTAVYLTPHHNSPQKRTQTKQSRQFMYKSNFEAHSSNCCCHGKAISINPYPANVENMVSSY